MPMIELIVMRLADMHRVHPDQIKMHCSRCGYEVAVYPSGQRVLEEHEHVAVVCQICKTPDANAELAPGAEVEVFESVKRK